jgi:hypothetical protein
MENSAEKSKKQLYRYFQISEKDKKLRQSWNKITLKKSIYKHFYSHVKNLKTC